MMEKLSFDDQLRIEELKNRIKIGFLARPIYLSARKLARLLYKGGYLADMTDKDLLTGLYNRNFYEEWVEKVASQAERAGVNLVLASIDVNGLKKMNDKYGHTAGDKMIINLSRVLLSSVRGSDLIIRMGGDEFLIIFWNAELEGINKKMGMIMEKAAKQEISFSFGLALCEKGKAIKRRYEEADEKMYQMKKRAGQGRV